MGSSSESLQVYDEHTISVFAPGFSTAELREVFTKALGRSDVSMRLNRIENKNGDYLGFTYVFIEDPKDYRMILGQKIFITDPNCVCPDPDSMPLPVSWADDEPHHCAQVELMYPLLDFDTKGKDLRIVAAFANRERDPEIKIVLTCILPRGMENIDLKRLQEHLSFYSSSGDRNWPVLQCQRGQLHVIFDPHTNDALFALYMIKKLNWMNRLLFFYPNDREMTYYETKSAHGKKHRKGKKNRAFKSTTHLRDTKQ